MPGAAQSSPVAAVKVGVRLSVTALPSRLTPTKAHSTSGIALLFGGHCVTESVPSRDRPQELLAS